MKIVFVTNVDWFFISHRLPLALHAIKEGNKVYLLTADTGKKTEIESYGIKFINVPFVRSGSNPFHELKCVLILRKLYKQIKPDFIYQVTLKASLLGSLAAKLCGQKNVVNAISGLGYNFIDGRDGLLQKTIKLVIRLAYKSKNFSFIIQNPDDLAMIKRLNLVPEENVFLIKGSGIDLKEFYYKNPIENNKVRILFPARILIDKGVMEFLNAAKLIREKVNERAIFILAGSCDNNNLAVLKEEILLDYLEDGYIEWIGYQQKMFDVYVNSDIVVLPSYREGLPKSLIEACAVGRPIITTDVPGCRECVVDGYNGYLVPAKDIEKMSEYLLKLIGDSELRKELGLNSRKLAEREFSIDKVIEKTFSI